MFEIVTGELRAKLSVGSAMRQARAGHDTRGQQVTPRCRRAGAWPGFETTHRTMHQRPGTTGVEGAGGTCRGAGGRRQGLARQHTDTPTDWRPPRGLRGLARLRDDAPSEARGADGERAGRPRGGRRSVGATSNAQITGKSGTTQHRGAGPQARAPSATTQTRTLRSTCARSRSARAARRWRRSSRSPRLRRQAGPRR